MGQDPTQRAIRGRDASYRPQRRYAGWSRYEVARELEGNSAECQRGMSAFLSASRERVAFSSPRVSHSLFADRGSAEVIINAYSMGDIHDSGEAWNDRGRHAAPDVLD